MRLSQKARTDVLELVRACLKDGPVDLQTYARIVGCQGDPLSWERSARRLVAKLREQGHKIEALGDGLRLTIDLSKAPRLVRRLPEAKALVSPQRATPSAMHQPPATSHNTMPSSNPKDEILDAKGLSRLLLISVWAARDLMRKKPFPVFCVSGTRGKRALRADVLAWIEEQKSK